MHHLRLHSSNKDNFLWNVMGIEVRSQVFWRTLPHDFWKEMSVCLYVVPSSFVDMFELAILTYHFLYKQTSVTTSLLNFKEWVPSPSSPTSRKVGQKSSDWFTPLEINLKKALNPGWDNAKSSTLNSLLLSFCVDKVVLGNSKFSKHLREYFYESVFFSPWFIVLFCAILIKFSWCGFDFVFLFFVWTKWDFLSEKNKDKYSRRNQRLHFCLQLYRNHFFCSLTNSKETVKPTTPLNIHNNRGMENSS